MSFKHNYTLICDEVRVENNGKFLILGLFTGPIGVIQIPVPMVLTFAHFFEADRPGNYSAKLRVEHLETGRRLVEGQAQLQVQVPGTVISPFKVPLQIEAVGAYNFILTVEGEREPIITPFTFILVRPPAGPGMMPMPMR